MKLGIDPTASDIHLGFAVVLRKLRQFQDLGHTAVLILGDYTAQIGDPSGRSVTRPRLSREQVDEYAATYIEQLRQILLPEPLLEIKRNSEWLAAMTIEDVLRLTSRTTVARMLERDDFAKRYAGGAPISVTEFLYPLLQGWDSVMVKADVELGGSDQMWNFLVARQLQEQEGQPPQAILTMPLLVGLDGAQKMSKSLGNYVGIAEPPRHQFRQASCACPTAHARLFQAHHRLASQSDRRGQRRAREWRPGPGRRQAPAGAHCRRPVPR